MLVGANSTSLIINATYTRGILVVSGAGDREGWGLNPTPLWLSNYLAPQNTYRFFLVPHSPTVSDALSSGLSTPTVVTIIHSRRSRTFGLVVHDRR